MQLASPSLSLSLSHPCSYASQNYSRVVQASAAADSGAFESSFGMRTPVAGAGAGAGSASRGHNPARQAKREAAGKPKRGELFFVKGALTAVLERCTASVRNHGDVVTLTPELREEIQTRNADMARQGLRVLALATGPRLTPAEGVDQSSTVEEAQAGGLTFLVRCATQRGRRAVDTTLDTPTHSNSHDTHTLSSSGHGGHS